MNEQERRVALFNKISISLRFNDYKDWLLTEYQVYGKYIIMHRLLLQGSANNNTKSNSV